MPLEGNESPKTPTKKEDLEVVAEDIMEDRYSMIQSVISSGNITLPCPRRQFIAAYKQILTEQELDELEKLNLVNDTVYYASDIQSRARVDDAVTNKDDEDGYYIIKPKDQILYRFEVIKVLGKGSFA